MKIYVTGLGVVSGIGIGVSENIEALQQGKHGIGKVTLFPTALDVPVSEVKRFFVKFGGNLFFISTVFLFFFLNPIKSCRYVCFLVTLKTPHH